MRAVFVDMKRIMTYVVISTIPCILWALYNTGYQANTALAALGRDKLYGWRDLALQSDGHWLQRRIVCLPI